MAPTIAGLKPKATVEKGGAPQFANALEVAPGAACRRGTTRTKAFAAEFKDHFMAPLANCSRARLSE
jgi:hypothetical protein